MTEKMELAYDVQKMSIIMLMIIVNLLPGVSGLIIYNTNATGCDGSRANITFDFDLEGGTIPSGSEAWYHEATLIGTITSGLFSPQGNYTSRLHTYSTYGIALDNVTDADAGRYLFVFSYHSPTPQGFKTATASLTVKVGPLNPSSPSGCLVKVSQSGNTAKCSVSGNCGTPHLIPSWVNVTTTDQFECKVGETYQCCATGAVLPLCYSGSSDDFCTYLKCESNATTTNITVTSSTTPTTNEPPVSTTSSTFTSISPTTELPHNDTNNTSTSRSPTTLPSNDTNNTSTSRSPTTVLPPSDTNNTSTSRNPTESTVSATSSISVKVIVPAVVVPCGLLIIVTIVLVVFCVRRKARKNVRERPDGMAIQDKGNNIDGWKQSFEHGKATDNIDTLYSTPDGFIIYPGPADISTARSYKDKKYHGVRDQYSRPNTGTHHHQADYIPSTYTSARAYTQWGKKRHDVTNQYSRPYPDTYGNQTAYFYHGVTDQYNRPYPGNYGNQTAYFPSTYKSSRTYAQKGKTYEGHQPVYNLMADSSLAYDPSASNLMATSRLANGQTAYYPQTGYYAQSGHDVFDSGGGQHSYGQRSRSHHDHSGRKPQRDYYSHYEMADYGGNGAGYRHAKQDTAFYY